MSPYRGFCGWCVSLFKWIPVIVISAIVAWSYYAYVVQLCIFTVSQDSEVAMVILLILYHIFVSFFVVSPVGTNHRVFTVHKQFQTSYWRTVWTKPGFVPKRFSLTSEELYSVEGCENDEEQRRFLEQIVIDKDLPVSMRTIQVRAEISELSLDAEYLCVAGSGEIL